MEKKITQVEFEAKMRKLRDDARQQKMSLHQLHTMKVQERKTVKKQIDDLYARSNALAVEINSITQQLQELNMEYAEKRKELDREFWSQFVPKDYKPFNTEMAQHVRYSVLNALRDALKPYCRIDDIEFNFHFAEDGNVSFKTIIPPPMTCQTQSETE